MRAQCGARVTGVTVGVPFPKMRPAAFRFCANAQTYSRPDELLGALQEVSRKHPQRLGVVAAWSIPYRTYRHDMSRINRTVFFHPEFRGEEFWAKYLKLAQERDGSAIDDYGRTVSHPFTLTEAMRALCLTGSARWYFNLLRDYGVRDGLYCPFRRWAVLFSSERPLYLERSDRHVLNMAAGIAVEQMERLVRTPRRRPITASRLTEREIAVLRLRSHGKSNVEIAAGLAISPVTVRNHLTNAAQKLKANNLPHAVAKAMREGLLS
jgi:DNA-binding CsgD family transcriptional regulator